MPFRQSGSDRGDQRAKRLRRALVCAAAVPAVLITAACSSDSGDSKDTGASAARQSAGSDARQPSASASPTVEPAAYGKLPESCAALSKSTLTDLVPKGAKSGKKGGSDDTANRSSCSWSSLDNNGVKGSQFRWLNVSLLRFDSDVARGSGEKQAHAYYAQQVSDAQGVDGAKNTKAQPFSGTGDEATMVRYDLKKKEGAFKQQTVVARVENVVVTLDYNGAGLAGEKTPDADDLAKAAEKAARETVASVSAANGKGSGASSPTAPSASPSKAASKQSAEPSSKPSSDSSPKSPSGKASPSASAGKKS
ncbi:DUF3558 domain-containing protein [Streptomyces sp. NBC_00820]|uniref:DUF3558 domain-containing protein n=1 Tax=Streptomyces sp. NBC_00820 TaxID=2975842 RepID=UPI002ED319F6|nr:DUF3558 domain-containing protein [Streptomyces sp. NBC_00820]